MFDKKLGYDPADPESIEQYAVYYSHKATATKAAYRFENGEDYGNVERDANMLPNGEYMTTQSFWINNSYILAQLKCLKE